MDAARKQGGNVLLLDAGDQFQGSLFYTVLKGRPSRDSVNALRYSAMTLGNHEFDDGTKMLADTFLSGLSVPVLAANVDASADASIKGKFKPWTILTVGGRKVGVVGIANEDTSRLSNPGPDVTFKNPDEPLRQAVKEVSAQGADIVVALTHVGLQRDKELAASVDGIDVIVGGAQPQPALEHGPQGRRTVPRGGVLAFRQAGAHRPGGSLGQVSGRSDRGLRFERGPRGLGRRPHNP